MANRGVYALVRDSTRTASDPIDGPADLYAGERTALTFGEALRVLIKGWKFFAAHRRLVILKFAIAISSMLLLLATPWPMKIIIDNVIDGHPLTGVAARILRPLVGTDRVALLTVVVGFLFFTAILGGISGDRSVPLDTDTGSGGVDQAGAGGAAANNGWSVWNGLLGWFETWITLDLTQRVNQDLRTAIYARFLRSPMQLYDEQKIGDAVFRVMNDSAGVGEIFYRGVLRPLMALTMFLGALVVITTKFRSEPMIPIGCALVMPLVAIVGAFFGRVFRNRAQTMRERGSDIMATFEERLANVQLIKAFGAEAHETRNVDSASWASYTATLKLVASIALMIAIVAPPILLMIIAGLNHLFGEVIDRRLSLGDVVLILSYMMMLGGPATDLGATWVGLQEPIAGLRRVFSVLDRLNEDVSGDAAVDLGKISQVELRNVSIAYEGGAPVVRDISFELRAGELVALAGPSGTGKTTIVSSIPRFIAPCAGEIVINGTDARRIPLDALRSRIGFVFQQEALFARSIADNIRYATPDARDEGMREAARLAGAAEFVAALPQQYDTMLGRRGARLSVGQKQRIAIARALIREPEVLVLDEPTAPLDPVSENALMRTLRDLARDRIVLIVAHRSSALSICDRVLFVADGTMIAMGPHEELRRTCARYREYLSIVE
jgi:ABC-type multidrug transport system fused ATPase/permease subunit